MRLEDKELEGPELEREQRLEELETETHENDKELPEHAGQEVVSSELEERTRLFDALRLIVAGENVSIPMLYLPQREEQALEALQSAVSGRDRSMGTFVFAEDRKSLLEQALSVLQQNLTRGDTATLAALHAQYEQLTDSVAELRDELLGLEDAQDDLIEQQVNEAHASDVPETTDTDAQEDDSVTGFIASALNALAQVAQVDGDQFRSTLEGPDLPERTTPPSMLDGPEVEREETSTTLTGAELPAPAPHVSVLDRPDGPEVPSKSDHVTSLDGPERPTEEKRSQLTTDGMSALIVPEHLRPRLAENPPVGMRTDDHVAPERPAQVADGRRLAQPTTSTPRRAEPEAPPATTEAADKMEDKPTSKSRGLSVRSSEKPRKKR